MSAGPVRRGMFLVLALASACASGHPGPRSIEVRMRYSRYLPGALSVPAGTTVEFVVVNADPIEHEFIVGTPAEQRAHERGPAGDPHRRPGEALIAPGATARVSYTFSRAGTFEFACHRPGHYAYGMRGEVRVT